MRSIQIDQGVSFSTFKHFEQTNRMLDRYGSDNFILFDFSRKVESATVRDILRNGITINGEEYQFIGCSSNGLKERTCYMYRGSSDDVEKVLKECGTFTSIKSRYKRLKRIGLLFSSATPTRIEIPDDKVIEERDIETPGGNFTDGCGAISESLAKRLGGFCSKFPDNYQPAVFQIRYQGCKGVVAVNPSLKDTAQLVIRPSMKKFQPGTKPFSELWLCDHSRPYTLGHLNRQFITLLSSLGVHDEVFLCIQNDHFRMLENVFKDPESAFTMFLLNNQPKLASLCTTGAPLSVYRSQLSTIRSKFVTKLEKLQLPVLKSRNVFGVCDPTGTLEHGQCFFRYTERGNSNTLQGRVVVAKNPCYLLGDVRILTAVHVEGLEHLLDCIVFPTQGKRPHPSEIAGSDLDGDQYFVCWDGDLIVPKVVEPYDYPSVDALETSSEVTQEMLIDCFASQRNNIGKIDDYYKYWANRKGAGCSECQNLGQLFSRSVDATKTGDVVSIPSKFIPPLATFVEKCSTKSPSEASHSKEECIHVWEEMGKRAKKERERLSTDIVNNAEAETISEEFLWYLLEDKVQNLSDFHLFQLIQRWCARQKSLTDDESRQKLLEFSKYINFGEFTVDQQVQAIDAGIPLETVTNALNKSTLLPQALLQKFLLDDAHQSWRFYFSCTSTEFNWQHLLRGLQHHPESMVIIKPEDEVTFVLHFLSPPQLGETNINGGSVVAYFSSGRFRLNLQCALGSEFTLILNKETLQLYRGNKHGTFIYLTSEQQGKKQRAVKETETLFDRISVDLTRFKSNIIQSDKHPRVNKQSLLSIEMFVKSTNFQPAFLDITEADVQDDYPVVEEATATEDIEELPSNDEDDEQEDDTTIESLDSYTMEAALAIASESAQKGHCRRFLKVLEKVHLVDIPKLLPPLKQLLATVTLKYCHRHMTDETTECLKRAIAPLYPSLTNPIDLLDILSQVGKLGLCSVSEEILECVSPNICAVQSSKYIDVVSKWQTWYFLPQKAAVRLSQHFYTLYTSLCDQPPASDQYSNWPDERGSISTTSLSDSELSQLASDQSISGSVQQRQVDQYVSHFSQLLLNYLLCEIFASQEVAKQVCDTSSSLVRMHCYDNKDPHSTQLEQDDDDTSATSWKVGFNRTNNISSKNFVAGSYVAICLMKKESSPIRVSSVPVAIGRIVSASRFPADIITEISEPVPLCLKRSALCCRGHWQLVLIGNITSFTRSLKALKSFRDNPSCTGLVPLLVRSHSSKLYKTTDSSLASYPGFHPRPLEPASTSDSNATRDPTVSTEPFIVQPLTPLNKSQEAAVYASLKQRLTLVHGPPGTGKTHVACEIVRQLLSREEDKSRPILVVAETNVAVDNLCEKLMIQQVRVIRIGKLEHISPHVRHISLEGQVEKKRVQEGKDKRKSPFPDKKMTKSILNAAQVVAATCTSAGDSSLKGMDFTFVIIDEATKVTEPTSLISLVHGCQRLTLIGDPEQLPPILPVTKNFSDTELPLLDLSVTLFHRLQRVLPAIFLTEQHRMHPELAVFPSQKFYGGRLLTASCRSQQQLALQEEIPILERSKPIAFVTVCKTEKRIGTSFCNPAEANAVVRIIDYLIKHKVSTQQIAVLTPYTGQLKCIQEQCQREKILLHNLYTIDSFQGREADVIVFSTVRCNTQGELGFVNDKYRMNVLLTRAKHGLIGIGCKETLSAGSPLWKEWLQGVKIIGDVHSIDTHPPQRRVDAPVRGHSNSPYRGVDRHPHVQGNAQSVPQAYGATQHGQSRHQLAGGATSRPIETRPGSSGLEGILSDQGQGRTANMSHPHDTQRSGYESRSRRSRGGRGRPRTSYRGRRGAHNMEPASQYWVADAVRGQRGNNRARRNRGRPYDYGSRGHGRGASNQS